MPEQHRSYTATRDDDRDRLYAVSDLSPASHAWSLRVTAVLVYVGTVVIVAAQAGISAGAITGVGGGFALILHNLATLMDREADR